LETQNIKLKGGEYVLGHAMKAYRGRRDRTPFI
jgi:hypothetical protein